MKKIVTELPTTKEPSSVEKRTGHGNRLRQQEKGTGYTRERGWQGGDTGSVAESGWRPEPTPCAYHGDHGTGQAPGYGVKLEVSKGSKAKTVKELMRRLEERAMRELLCWCMRQD